MVLQYYLALAGLYLFEGLDSVTDSWSSFFRRIRKEGKRGLKVDGANGEGIGRHLALIPRGAEIL